MVMVEPFNAANALRFIRDHGPVDVSKILDNFMTEEELKGDTGRQSSLSSGIEYVIDGLMEAGLVEKANVRDSSSYSEVHDYKISDNWNKIQGVLALSLTQLAKLDSPSAFIAEPLFGKPSRRSNLIDIFVLMPFTDKLKPVWEDHIKNVASSLGLTAKRADDFFTAHAVMRDVWDAISTSRILIADCTDRNPNVFYEIGVAHTVGKPVILCTQNSSDVPFDLRHIRYIEYENTPPGMRKFEASLTETIKSLFNDAK
jgi:hypothetical protein